MGANQWRDEQEWPLARARQTAYYLSSGGRANTLNGDGVLGTSRPAATLAAGSLRLRPEESGARRAPAAAIRERRRTSGPPKRATTCSSTRAPPLAEDVEVTGPLALTLWIQSSARDTDFTGKLVDVFPDGTARALADGILRGAIPQRADHARAAHAGRADRDHDRPRAPPRTCSRPGTASALEVSSSNFPALRSQPEHRRRIRRGPRGAHGRPDDPARRGASVAADSAGGACGPATGNRRNRQTAAGSRQSTAIASFIVTQRAAGGRHRDRPSRPAAVRVVNGRITEVGTLDAGPGRTRRGRRRAGAGPRLHRRPQPLDRRAAHRAARRQPGLAGHHHAVRRAGRQLAMADRGLPLESCAPPRPRSTCSPPLVMPPSASW